MKHTRWIHGLHAVWHRYVGKKDKKKRRVASPLYIFSWFEWLGITNRLTNNHPHRRNPLRHHHSIDYNS